VIGGLPPGTPAAFEACYGTPGSPDCGCGTAGSGGSPGCCHPEPWL